jgi:hypothetical protein
MVVVVEMIVIVWEMAVGGLFVGYMLEEIVAVVGGVVV